MHVFPASVRGVSCLRMRRRLLPLFLCLALAGCDRQPIVVDSTAALSPPGAVIPDFKFPGIREHWEVDRTELGRGHTLVALVPGSTTGQEPAMVEFDSLHKHYPWVRAALVYARPLQKADTTYLNIPLWLYGVMRGFTTDSQMIAVFGAGLRDSSDKHRRPVFALPSFLVVSDSLHVLARAAGSPAPLRHVLDSLHHIYDSTRTAEANADIASARPHIEAGLGRFDPDSLVAPDARLDLSVTCGGEEGADLGFIPAVGRLISIDGASSGVYTTVEFVSVADVEGADTDNLCQAEELRATPRVTTKRYQVAFYEQHASAQDSSAWYIDTSFKDDSTDGYKRYAIFGLKPRGKARFILPDGVTVETLRARIDSIRRAQAAR